MGKLKHKTLTATGVVSTAGKTSRLIEANFIGLTAGDKLEIKDGGTGGAVQFTLPVSAYGQARLGPFARQDGPVFLTDIYGTITKTTSGWANFVFEELE